MFKWFVLAFCVVNPLAYSFQMESRIAQEFCFQISSLLLIMSSMMFSNKSNVTGLEKKFNIALFSLFAWCMYIFFVDKQGWTVLFNFFLGLGVYVTVARCLDKKDIEFLIRGVLWIAAFAIFFLFLQFCGFDMRNQQLLRVGGIPHVSFFALEACYGVYLAMVLPLLLGISQINNIDIEFLNTNIKGRLKLYFRNFKKILIVVAYVVLLLASCWPSNSTGAFIGLVVAVLAYLWYKRRVFFWFVFIPAVVTFLCFILLYDNPMGMQGSRIDMWKKVIQDSHQKPLGHGLDSFRLADKEGDVRYFKYSFNNTTERIKKTNGQWTLTGNVSADFMQRVQSGKSPLDFWDNPHAIWATILYEMGLVGFVLMGVILYLFVMIFRSCRKNALDVALFCSMVAVLICSLTQFPFHLARNGHLIPIVLGMFIISVKDDNRT